MEVLSFCYVLYKLFFFTHKIFRKSGCMYHYRHFSSYFHDHQETVMILHGSFSMMYLSCSYLLKDFRCTFLSKVLKNLTIYNIPVSKFSFQIFLLRKILKEWQKIVYPHMKPISIVKSIFSKTFSKYMYHYEPLLICYLWPLQSETNLSSE